MPNKVVSIEILKDVLLFLSYGKKVRKGERYKGTEGRKEDNTSCKKRWIFSILI